MARTLSSLMCLTGLLVCSLSEQAWGQTTQPAPSSAPAAGVPSLVYEVIAVQGKVRIAPTGTDPLRDEGWSAVQVGDSLVAGKQICVPLRGALKLVARPADPPTVIMIEPSTLVNISELSIQSGTARSRIDLGYGAIRAGVAEGNVRSDMQIQCPVATLSKRGTDIFRFEYHEGRFFMSLSEQGRGMIQAIQMQSGSLGQLNLLKSRFVTPGQFVTQQMARAIDTMQFDRRIVINDLFGLIGSEKLMLMTNQLGLGFLIQPGINTIGGLRGQPIPIVPTPPQGGLDPVVQSLQGAVNVPLLPPIRRTQKAGDFGIGQGPLPPLLPGMDFSTVARESPRKAFLRAMREQVKPNWSRK